METLEKTPEPVSFRDLSRKLRKNGFSYAKERCGFTHTDSDGTTWIARMREDKWGVNIDLHYVDAEGKERAT